MLSDCICTERELQAALLLAKLHVYQHTEVTLLLALAPPGLHTLRTLYTNQGRIKHLVGPTHFTMPGPTGGGTYSADTAIAVPLLKVVRLTM